jgi:hypothetical protein
MGQPREDLYFLTNQDGLSYYVNEYMVGKSAMPVPVPIGPDGWLTKSIKFSRNFRWLGLFRTFTNSLKFVREAAKIVRSRLYLIGTEDKLYLNIFRLDKSFGGGWIHKFFYKGELDLTQADDEETFISTNIMEGELTKLLNANSRVVYSVPITGPLVLDDGILLLETANFTVVDGLDMKFGLSPTGLDHNLTIVNTSTEGESAGVTFVSQSDTPPFTDQFFAENTTTSDLPATINVRLVGKLLFQCTQGTGGNVIIYFNPDRTSSLTRVVLFTGNLHAGEEHVVPFDVTVPLAFAQKMQLAATQLAFGSDSTTTIIHFELGSAFTASFTNRFRESLTPTMRPVVMAQALLDKMTGGGYTVQSDYLTEWENLVITSGDAVRGIADAVIKTSFDDWYTSYNAVLNLCLSVKGSVLLIERKKYAFNDTIIADLGEVAKLKIAPATDHAFSSVSVGYPDLDTHSFQSLNGKEEFNVTSVFTSSVTRNSNVLDLTSKYKASMYEQELARINLQGQNTTSDSNDNNVFFKDIEKNSSVKVDGTIYYKLFRDTYDSIAGLLDPASAFNVRISPKNNLLRHGNYLRSVFYWLEGTSLIFQTSDRNATLKTVKAGVTIDESANVNIGSLDDPLFIPLEMSADSPMPDGMIDIMNSTPEGTIQFEYNGVSFYGFANEVSIQPASKTAQTTTMLCSTQTDLSKLIDR